MGLESVTLIKDLNVANPAPGDNKAEGDDHLRNIKKALLNTFPKIDKAITKTADQLNAANRVAGSNYETIVGDTNPMLELHRPGKVAFAQFIGADNRLYWFTSNGGGGISNNLFSIGPGADMYVANSLSVANSISSAYFKVNANNSSYYTMGINGQADRHLHRNGDAMGFLGLDGNWNLYSHNNGDTWSRGNVAAFSDERVKKDWKQIGYDTLNDFAEMTLVGTYTNIKTEQRMAGVSAQQLQKILPECVTGTEEDLLGVVYGNAALVLVHKLTQRLLALELEVAELRRKA